MKVKGNLRDSHAEVIIRWALLFTKKVKIDHYKPLPTDIVNLLVKNQSEFHNINKKIKYIPFRFKGIRLV